MTTMYRIEGEYYDFPQEVFDIILTKEELEFYNDNSRVNPRLPCASKKWRMLSDISDKAVDYFYKNRSEFSPRVAENTSTRNVYTTNMISDGMDATFCPADGKVYDSRSGYYAAVKNKGLEIVGNDAPTERASPATKEIDWRPEVAQAIKQLK